jgi:hypothetical protein
MSEVSVVIITGTIPLDLKPASKVLAYFIKLGCEIQSSNLYGTTFLYTLVRQKWVCMDEGEYLKTLQGIGRSADFSVTYA